jgi:hypothetical protein
MKCCKIVGRERGGRVGRRRAADTVLILPFLLQGTPLPHHASAMPTPSLPCPERVTGIVSESNGHACVCVCVCCVCVFCVCVCVCVFVCVCVCVHQWLWS